MHWEARPCVGLSCWRRLRPGGARQDRRHLHPSLVLL